VDAIPSPWKTAAQAAARVNRSKQFLMREIRAGRLRAARIGGRGEYLLRDEWVDAWVEEQATPILVPIRKRA
jgi:excisionase family DNA binding protein